MRSSETCGSPHMPSDTSNGLPVFANASISAPSRMEREQSCGALPNRFEPRDTLDVEHRGHELDALTLALRRQHLDVRAESSVLQIVVVQGLPSLGKKGARRHRAENLATSAPKALASPMRLRGDPYRHYGFDDLSDDFDGFHFQATN